MFNAVRIVLAAQAALTVAIAAVAGLFAGLAAGAAAALGGATGVAGTLAYGLCWALLAGGRARATLRPHLAAEAGKVGVIVTLLPLALGWVAEPGAFVAGFAASLMAYPFALLLDHKKTMDLT
ncbi:MAG: hypothetical protein ACK4N4_07495 [Burkholderiales bacterium]